MMGKIVGVFSMAHSPGMTGFPERADAAQRAAVMEAFAIVGHRINSLRPDLVIVVSVDHFSNFSLANLPSFAIATAESYLGPVTPEMAIFLKIEQRQYLGDVGFGEYLYRSAIENKFDPALVQGDLAFDENFCVPLRLLDPKWHLPLVPVIVNGVNQPAPTIRRCYEFGRMIRTAVEASEDGRRVVVLGTGGLSHWVGMPEAGNINEEFDLDFLDRLASGDSARLTAYRQDEIDRAGNGANEIRPWVVAAGAAATEFEILAYEPISAWLTGTAVAAARL